MKVFLSHARKDDGLARELAKELRKRGLRAWLAAEEVGPGDNWAKKIGKALDDSELMVVLLTPKSVDSDWVREDIQFALGSRKYERRVYSVFVGPTAETGKDFPWILLKLPHAHVESAKDFPDVVKEIKALCADSRLSHSHA